MRRRGDEAEGERRKGLVAFASNLSPFASRLLAPFVGVDGCRAGWVASDGAQAEVFASFAALMDAHAGATVAIDIPIGLLAEGTRGDRACDKAARRLLGPRRASVFPPPTRAQLIEVRGLSLQTRNIVPKIREVDAWLAAHPGARVFEAHPELAFAQANGAPMRHAKRTAAGRLERARVLRRLELLPRRRPRGCAVDDLHDASILSWTARRIAHGRALILGEPTLTIRA